MRTFKTGVARPFCFVAAKALEEDSGEAEIALSKAGSSRQFHTVEIDRKLSIAARVNEPTFAEDLESIQSSEFRKGCL